MKPLDGLTILDLSHLLACPFASMILAELGATVIKVEQPGTGDETRTFKPKVGEDSAYYFACNRSKRSITVNLGADEGRRIVRELSSQVDVFVENFPTGTLARQGLDYNTLSGLNPRLVYLSCTGFGQSGPYAMKKGDDAVRSMRGLAGLSVGSPETTGSSTAELSAGLWMALAMLAALAGRVRTGKGCHVDFSMFDAQVSLLTIAAAHVFAGDDTRARPGTEGPDRAPSATALEEVLADAQVRARRIVGSFDYPGVGEFRALALPYKFLGWDDPQIGAPPTLGEHTDAVLAQCLGYDPAKIAALRESGAI